MSPLLLLGGLVVGLVVTALLWQRERARERDSGFSAALPTLDELKRRARS